MSIDKQVNLVKETLEKEIERYRRIIFDGLLETTYNNAIPESLFKNYFLPCFLGQSDNSNWVLEWISIAGTPMAEVAVFDDATKEILFIVPSILNTNNLLLNNTAGNLSDIFTRYEQLSNNIPSTGIKFLLEALNAKNDELISKINLDEANNRWINILKRYNLIKEDNLNVSNKDNNADLGDFLDF